MRSRTAAAVAATTVLGAGTAVLAGRYASGAALMPGRPLPGEPKLTVHSTAAGHVTLTRTLATQRPGMYGLTGDGCHAAVGPVVDSAPHPPDCVVRRLETVTRGTLEPGARVWLTPQVYAGDPSQALGLAYEKIDIPGELGPLPAWFVPAARDTWVITAHGLGGTREHPLVVMDFLHRKQLPVLDVAYRGDAGAPRSPDGVSRLGHTEWRDLDAAVRYATQRGARRVVLFGWSTGASMALHTAMHSSLRHLISGIILDSPVLDWQTTLRALAAARGTPRFLLPLVVRAAQGRTSLHAGHLAEFADVSRLSVPALIVHGPDDHLAPWATSRELADRRPDLITLRSVPRAPHAAMWNADPAGYEEALRRFLTPLV
ncbi:alpha/beta hydrolase [Streptomyces zagrosensis]|uniref:Serine aminopeptidase S33 domain-containing protein n=1 Tax=Streptomyces zagrosensis TaxID=1042984 RepID=A0A7W9Q5V3_9ACTN|nr:DUF1749 domain-containing protein [Streptomyces zagrosensis]MBB5933688.1 hypothetical protein [Streptomyces zagrosensis]